jgi:hypothetical protein
VTPGSVWRSETRSHPNALVVVLRVTEHSVLVRHLDRRQRNRRGRLSRRRFPTLFEPVQEVLSVGAG